MKKPVEIISYGTQYSVTVYGNVVFVGSYNECVIRASVE